MLWGNLKDMPVNRLPNRPPGATYAFSVFQIALLCNFSPPFLWASPSSPPLSAASPSSPPLTVCLSSAACLPLSSAPARLALVCWPPFACCYVHRVELSFPLCPSQRAARYCLLTCLQTSAWPWDLVVLIVYHADWALLSFAEDKVEVSRAYALW
jgi:hypothetical protein